jgi:NTE family protein
VTNEESRIDPEHLRIGLVLGAGAGRGWAHIGVLKALAAQGIQPDIICGCSIGALVGASCVTNHLDSLEALARSLTTSRVLRYFDVSLRGGGLIEGRWIIELFRENVEDTAIENASPIYGAVATDLASGRETWLTSGSIIDAVRASIAIPGLLTPIQIRGRWHVDGALINPLPVSLCRALGADRIIAVNLNGNLMSRGDIRASSPAHVAISEGAPPAGEARSSWLQWLGYGQGDLSGPADIVPAANKRPGYLDVVSQTFFLVQDFVSRIRLAADPVDVLIAPDVANIGWMEFHRAAEAIEAGESAVLAALPSIRLAIGQGEPVEAEGTYTSG